MVILSNEEMLHWLIFIGPFCEKIQGRNSMEIFILLNPQFVHWISLLVFDLVKKKQVQKFLIALCLKQSFLVTSLDRYYWLMALT